MATIPQEEMLKYIQDCTDETKQSKPIDFTASFKKISSIAATDMFKCFWRKLVTENPFRWTV